MPKTVLIFILIGALFALTHAFALVTALYWYYPWFDMIMHLWGGMLIVLGIHALSKVWPVYIKPNKRTILPIALLTIIGWEVFERVNGLFIADVYFIDTTMDILIGLIGVIIGYKVLKLKKS